MSVSHSKTSETTVTESTLLSGGGSGGGSEPSLQGSTVETFTSLPFAMTSGQAKTSVFIDYTSGTGIKFFNSATTTKTKTFDGDYKVINIFNYKLLDRAKK